MLLHDRYDAPRPTLPRPSGALYELLHRLATCHPCEVVRDRARMATLTSDYRYDDAVAVVRDVLEAWEHGDSSAESLALRQWCEEEG